MDVNLVVVAVSGLFFAGIIKGATGIGYSSCALPFLVASLGLKEAIVLVVAPAMASNVAVLFTTGSLRRSLRTFWPLYVSTLPGILCGIFLLLWADKHIPTQILGVIICAYAILGIATAQPFVLAKDSKGRAGPSGIFERPAHGLHRLASHALDALHACPQPGPGPFRAGGKHRCCDRVSFLGLRALARRLDVVAGIEPFDPGNCARRCSGSTSATGQDAIYRRRSSSRSCWVSCS